jgi:RimJ/RimL family protein N-acetyltransferase
MRIETTRLLIRPWQEADHDPWAAISADPEVRRYYWPSVLTREESDQGIAWCERHLAKHGFGFVAVERRSDKALVGGLGFSWAAEEVPNGPHVEIGWIFGRQYWGQGLAYEAAQAGLAWASQHIAAPEIIGYTSAINTPSRRLMEKLGMRYDPADDFEDTSVPEGNPLRPHVLYRIANRAD